MENQSKVLMENYENALQAIYDHVGFVEDYVIYPIDDETNMYWWIGDDCVHYAKTITELENEAGNYYVDEIYTQRFYAKHMYEGKDITMIFCNPNVDGMKYFRIFDNSKRRQYYEK